MRRPWILPALALLAFTGCNRSPDSPEPLPALTEGTRIVTWNLHWLPGHTQKATPDAEAAHIEAVAATIAELDADILCLQEIKGAEAAERLLEALPGYRLQVVSNFRGTQEIAILSRIDAVTAFAEEFTKAENTPPRGFVYAAFDIDGRRLLVYSVHLKSNIGGIAENIPKREESARQLLAHAEEMHALHKGETGTEPVIVLAGDFNTSPSAPSFAAENTAGLIQDAGFVWTFQGLLDSETVTWLSDGRYPDASFDHVFVRPAESAGRAAVIPTDRSVSDHRPVVLFVTPQSTYARGRESIAGRAGFQACFAF